MTKAYGVSLCAQVGGHRHINSTTSSVAARVSGTATSTNNGTMIHTGTTIHNGTFMGVPAPFTGGTGVIESCGAVVLAGLLVGGMAVVL